MKMEERYRVYMIDIGGKRIGMNHCDNKGITIFDFPPFGYTSKLEAEIAIVEFCKKQTDADLEDMEFEVVPTILPVVEDNVK